MICKNCHKEIGSRTDCNLCGYDPALDGDGTNVNYKNELTYVPPPPIDVTPLKASNGMAKASFIMGLLGFVPYLWFLSIPFGIIGFFKAKNCRSGRVRAVLGLVFTVVWIAVYAWIISIAMQGQSF